MTSDRTDWSAVIVAVGAGMVVAMQVGKLPPVLPQVRADLGLTLIAGGWIASTVAFMSASGGIVSGLLADRIGARLWASLGLLSVVLGSLAGAVAESMDMALLGRIFEGFGFVSVAVSAPSLITARTSPGHQRFALGLWGAYMPAGMALIMIVTPFLFSLIGWRGIWLMESLIAAIVLGLFLLMIPSGTGSARLQDERPQLVSSLRRPGPWLLAGSFGCYTLQWLTAMTWFPTFMQDVLGLGLATAAPLTALVVLMNVPGNILGGLLLQRGWVRWKIMVGAEIVMAISGFCMFSDGLSAFVKYPVALIFSLVGGLLPAASLSGAPLHARDRAEIGVVNGIIVQGANTGSFLGPPAVAFLVSMTGDWQAVRIFLLIAVSGGIILALGLRRIEGRVHPA